MLTNEYYIEKINGLGLNVYVSNWEPGIVYDNLIKPEVIVGINSIILLNMCARFTQQILDVTGCRLWFEYIDGKLIYHSMGGITYVAISNDTYAVYWEENLISMIAIIDRTIYLKDFNKKIYKDLCARYSDFTLIGVNGYPKSAIPENSDKFYGDGVQCYKLSIASSRDKSSTETNSV